MKTLLRFALLSALIGCAVDEAGLTVKKGASNDPLIVYQCPPLYLNQYTPCAPTSVPLPPPPVPGDPPNVCTGIADAECCHARDESVTPAEGGPDFYAVGNAPSLQHPAQWFAHHPVCVEGGDAVCHTNTGANVSGCVFSNGATPAVWSRCIASCPGWSRF